MIYYRFLAQASILSLLSPTHHLPSPSLSISLHIPFLFQASPFPLHPISLPSHSLPSHPVSYASHRPLLPSHSSPHLPFPFTSPSLPFPYPPISFPLQFPASGDVWGLRS